MNTDLLAICIANAHPTYSSAYTKASERAAATKQPQAIEYDRPSGTWRTFAVDTAPAGAEVVRP